MPLHHQMHQFMYHHILNTLFREHSQPSADGYIMILHIIAPPIEPLCLYIETLFDLTPIFSCHFANLPDKTFSSRQICPAPLSIPTIIRREIRHPNFPAYILTLTIYRQHNHAHLIFSVSFTIIIPNISQVCPIFYNATPY